MYVQTEVYSYEF